VVKTTKTDDRPVLRPGARRKLAFMKAIDVGVELTPAMLAADSEESAHSIRDALLAAIVESSDDAIVCKTLAGTILSWNAGATRIFGYRSEEVIGKPITIIIPAELHDEERRILDQIRRGERIDHYDTIRMSKDGRRIPISLCVSPVRDSRGVIIGASKVARDVSERKRAEQALQESERRLKAEVDELAKLNERSTRLWRVRSLDEGLEEMLTAVTELLGAEKGYIQLLDGSGSKLVIAAQLGFDQDFLTLFSEVRAADEYPCARALRSGERVVIEDVESDSAYAPFRANLRAAGVRSVISTPLLDALGRPFGVASTHFRLVHRPAEQVLNRLDLYLRLASDFIQRCKMDQALLRSEEALREADRRKDEFLALLAHELRNPLAPIRYSLAANRKSGRTPAQQQQAEEVIERQVTHMSRLLDDLLDVSRITRSALQLKKHPTEIASVIGAAVETARPLLEAKNHSLSVDLPEEAVPLEADAVRLAQVFSNLLINAAKYTDPGGRIGLRAARSGREILVAIRDNGMGISADMVPRLFTMFSQAQPALGRAEGGLGVGLALARGLVALHDGSIEARSDGPGKGSEFIVRLPAEVPPTEILDSEPLAAVPAAGSGLKVLIVDDNRDAADACAMLLELSGHHVQTAYTGLRGLDLAESFHPHVLLLDIGLPDLNGYELAVKIRNAPWGRGIILVAVTGWGQEEDRRRAFEAGCDHHLTKPVSVEAVESLLRSLGPSISNT
jgi:PAS domain S-box-containing protein